MIVTSRAARQLGGLVLRLSIPAFVLVATACSSAEAPQDDSASTDTQALSTTIHSEYGVTTFGGPGDYQAMACGENSRTSQEWYVASSQRYGCNVHLQLTADGKCLVVQTEDAGPASFVESHAGIAVLDSSPAVGRFLFGQSGLGWEDIKDHPGKYQVHAVVTKLPLGPCSTSTPPAPTPTPTPTPTGDDDDSPPISGSTGTDAGSDSGSASTVDSGSGASSGSGTSSSGGVPCRSDGQCNPGDDGSGMICVKNSCTPGCNADWECPGRTSCQSGTCQ